MGVRITRVGAEENEVEWGDMLTGYFYYDDDGDLFQCIDSDGDRRMVLIETGTVYDEGELNVVGEAHVELNWRPE
jgi:hypothetical protein